MNSVLVWKLVARNPPTSPAGRRAALIPAKAAAEMLGPRRVMRTLRPRRRIFGLMTVWAAFGSAFVTAAAAVPFGFFDRPAPCPFGRLLAPPLSLPLQRSPSGSSTGPPPAPTNRGGPRPVRRRRRSGPP